MDTNDSLKKELGIIDVFAMASGAMISSGLFILPAIAFAKAGPAMILSYLIASLLVIPSMLSKAELSTAMPKAGGTYFFVERSLGAWWGLFSGLANWFSVALKSAFAVVGTAILIEVIVQMIAPVTVPSWQLKALSAGCCIYFTIMNIVSVKHTSRLQIILVAALLLILGIFIAGGTWHISVPRYDNFLGKGWAAIIATAGLVFISFGGLTKVTSIAEEVKDPGKNIPIGMILAWLVVSLCYLAVCAIIVGVLDSEELITSNLPASLAASKFMGNAGFVILALAAIAAFVTTANSGILAASRYPLAMSRDGLLPPQLATLSKKYNTPITSIVITGAFMTASVVLLDLEVLVKTASTLMIVLFMLVNASVIIMRASSIQSYQPKFKSPLYPYLHIAAIISYGVLIIDMGAVPLLISAAFILLSAVWYYVYISRHVDRASAAMHIVERVTNIELKTVTLENELRDILLARDNIIEDKFDQLIRECTIIDLDRSLQADEVFWQASEMLATFTNTDKNTLYDKFLQRERESSTIIQPGLAIPHIIIKGEGKFQIILVRAIDGIVFPNIVEPVKTMFILCGSKDERNYHLRALMAIAQIVQEKDFEERWLAARDKDSLRNLILLSNRKRDH